MHRILSTILLLAWGLWFGAIVMVFVTVTSLFSTLADRQVAGAAAAGVFKRFEMIELVAAAVAVVAAFLLRSRPRPKPPVVALLLLIGAAAGALYTGFVLTPEIDTLRGDPQRTASDYFQSLHRLASAVYVVKAALLLATGLFLPRFLSPTETSAATAAE